MVRDVEELLPLLKKIIPPLTGESHKGQHGKVGIVGGCREYTGAPYFAAISAVKTGADLSHVFCTPTAAAVIKTYSPELIVLPYIADNDPLDDEAPAPNPSKSLHLITPWLSKLSCLIIGPGLGDDPLVVDIAKQVLRMAREIQLPLVVDGSGLNFVAREPQLVKGYQQCVMTPNLAEFGRLAKGVGLDLRGDIGAQWQEQTEELAKAFEGPVVVSKGPADVISDGQETIRSSTDCSPRRAGGQGDVMTGTTATFITWAKLYAKKHPNDTDLGVNPMMLAAFGGSLVMRAASRAAFKQKGRSMLAGDIIEHVGEALP